MQITDTWISSCAKDCGIGAQQIEKTIGLLEEGGTVPFIARYRKEVTGSLDEVQIELIRDSLNKHRELEKRKANILATLQERELLTGELRKKIEIADNLTCLEDIYLPFKQKRNTRAAIAREKGLEGLAKVILKGGRAEGSASSYVSQQKGVPTAEDALAGARDIAAELISENSRVRKFLRDLFERDALIVSSVIEKRREEAKKFEDYFDWQEPVTKLPGHRLLALLRGADLKLLKLSLRPERDAAQQKLSKFYTSGRKENLQLMLAIQDSYDRLLAPSLENELKKKLKKKADDEAIEVFTSNLKKLLLAPPLGQKRVMALDPGYRTGAKLVCLGEQGALLHRETVYPTHRGKSAEQAGEIIRRLVKKFEVEAICIGNGTAGRETEKFIRELGLEGAVLITLVNEDGASIYSASETARKEFPDEDITVRGAVSIGRRLQDPLAELVKIDPKSIGVGQYQHDVNQGELKKSLEQVVVHCVNHVGVELNSASEELLSFVAGLGPVLASNIINYRQENGPFTSRKELLKVPRLGAKAFEQCAGFLRLRNSNNPLDNSGVHPERYMLVHAMAVDHGLSVEDLLRSADARKRLKLRKYTDDNVGMETLADIMAELAMPGRDPRQKFSAFQFDERVHAIEDLEKGMVLPAVITNVTKFGAFADVGIKQDGLIHISQMADRFVKDPAEIVSVRDQVRVRVTEVDIERKRIGLSLRL